MRSLLALVVMVLALCPAWASAQPSPVVVNPSTIEWTPSADHAVTLSDGTAILTRYEVRIYMRGATEPFQTYNAGKPAPVNGKIAITNPAWMTLSAMNTEGFARVAAIGLVGEGVSDPSNPFARVGPPAVPPAPVVR